MNQPIYLVTGATGATGKEAVAALLGSGCRVRAFVHREDDRSAALAEQGAEICVGDFADLHSVSAAVQGIRAAYFCYPISVGIVEATALFAHAARKAGVEAVVNMSQIVAREDAKSRASFSHWLAERVFDWSDVPVTHLRPGFFTEWLLAFAPMIQQGVVYAPFGKGKSAFVAAEDQGRVIAALLRDPSQYLGKTLQLFGSAEVTFEEAIEISGRALGRHIAFHRVPFEVMVDNMLNRTRGLARNDAMSGYAESNVPDAKGHVPVVQHLREAFIDHDHGKFEGMNSLIEQITGRTPMSIEAFVKKHAQAFAAAQTAGSTSH